MNGPGTRWQIGALEAIEVGGSTEEHLRVCVIDSEWPGLPAPIRVPREYARPAESRLQRVGGAEELQQ